MALLHQHCLRKPSAALYQLAVQGSGTDVAVKQQPAVRSCKKRGATMLTLHQQAFRPAPASRARRLRVAASSDNGAAFAIPEGARIKVVKPVKVYHAPKQPQGVDLEGLEGTVTKHAALFKGKVLSLNLPYKVQFETKVEGAPVKFFAHLVGGRILHAQCAPCLGGVS